MNIKIIVGLIVIMLAGGFMMGCLEAPTAPKVEDVVEVVEVLEVAEAEHEDIATNFYEGVGYNISSYNNMDSEDVILTDIIEVVEFVEDVSSGGFLTEMVQDEEYWEEVEDLCEVESVEDLLSWMEG